MKKLNELQSYLTRLRGLMLTLIILCSIGVGNVWGTTITDQVNTFGLNSTPSGWSVSSKNTHVANYLKMSAGDYLEMTTASVFASGEVLSSDNMTVEVSCGTFGSWSNPRSIKCTVEFRNSDNTILSTANATFSRLNSTEGTYRTAINVAKPTNPTQIAYLRITFSDFKSGSVLRVKNVKLKYETSKPAVTSYTIYVANNCGDGNSYSVTGAGASTGTYGDWADTYSVSDNTEITLGHTEGSGQTFDGWEDAVLDKSGTSITVTNNRVTVTKDVYVYCNFSASCTNGTVSYAKGSTTHTGGNAITGSHVNDTKTCGTNMTLPGVVFTTTGYTQDGWATSDGGSKVYDLSATNYAKEGDATLYPHWTANKYTVTWSVNGSTYTTTENVTYNTTTSTPANPSVPGECTGSTFMGWTENSSWASDSAPGDLFNGTTPTITGNKTFYAVFADEN